MSGKNDGDFYENNSFSDIKRCYNFAEFDRHSWERIKNVKKRIEKKKKRIRGKKKKNKNNATNKGKKSTVEVKKKLIDWFFFVCE